MKLYVLIRGDLTPGEQLAQVGHVCAGLGASVEIPDPIVVLEVEDRRDLLAYLSDPDDGWYAYYDPDCGGHTAIARVCDGRGLEHLPLAGRGKAAMTVS